MNRVFFLILIIAFLLVPLSINNVNDDGVSYFDLVLEVSESLFENSETDKKNNVTLSDSQKQLISEKLQALTNSNKNLFNNFEETQEENLKDINEYLSLIHI